MSTSSMPIRYFLAEGTSRISIYALVLFVVGAAGFYAYSSDAQAIAGFVNPRREAVFNAAFTFLSVFWAALLTICSLLKSRATRHIERLSDNVVFVDFMRALETRIVIGMGALVLSFAMYIAIPELGSISSLATISIIVWFAVYFGSIILLFDSLLIAKIALE